MPHYATADPQLSMPELAQYMAAISTHDTEATPIHHSAIDEYGPHHEVPVDYSALHHMGGLHQSPHEDHHPEWQTDSHAWPQFTDGPHEWLANQNDHKEWPHYPHQQQQQEWHQDWSHQAVGEPHEELSQHHVGADYAQLQALAHQALEHPPAHLTPAQEQTEHYLLNYFFNPMNQHH